MTTNTVINNTEKSRSEYHIASLVASPILAQLDEVKAAILAVEGTEIHATSDEGKIVFTVEGTGFKDLDKKIDIVRVHKGILNVSPVYHQVLDESTNIDEAS